jgi:hypothetical protein
MYIDNEKEKIILRLRQDRRHDDLVAFLSGCEDYHWYFASPNNPMTQLSDTAFNHAVRLWLGIPLFDNSTGIINGQNCRKCGDQMEARGLHAFTCSHIVGPARRHTHDMVRDSLYYNFRNIPYTDFRVVREQNVQSFYGNAVRTNSNTNPVHQQPGRYNDSYDRGDLSIVHQDPLKSRIIDFVTVYPHPNPRTNPLNFTRKNYNFYANKAEERKVHQYQSRFDLQQCNNQNPAIGAGIDIYGAFGDHFDAVIKYVADISGNHEQWDKANFVRKCREYSQVALMRGNSDNITLWLRECCPQQPNWNAATNEDEI